MRRLSEAPAGPQHLPRSSRRSQRAIRTEGSASTARIGHARARTHVDPSTFRALLGAAELTFEAAVIRVTAARLAPLRDVSRAGRVLRRRRAVGCLRWSRRVARRRRPRARVWRAGAGTQVDAALSETLGRGPIFTLGTFVVGQTAADVVVRGRHSRAGVRSAGIGRDDDAALGGALVDGAVFALGAAVVGDAADDVASRRRWRPLAGVRQAGRRRGDGAALVGALLGGAILAFRAAVVRDAADHVADSSGLGGGEDRGKDVLASGVADHQRGAPGVEAEQPVVRRARIAPEPRLPAAPAGRRDGRDQNAVRDQLVGRIGIEVIDPYLEAALVAVADSKLGTTARIGVDAGRDEVDLLSERARVA